MGWTVPHQCITERMQTSATGGACHGDRMWVSTLIYMTEFKAKCTARYMDNTSETELKQGINCGPPGHESPSPTARSREFIPDVSIADMEEYLKGLDDCKESDMVLIYIKKGVLLHLYGVCTYHG